MRETTDQEDFWRGGFGNEYVDRNSDNLTVASNAAFFRQVFSKTAAIGSVLELGANVGLNLRAISTLVPEPHLAAVEINEKAAAGLISALPSADVRVESILDFAADERWDLVFTKGVLIHISPDALPSVYEVMHRHSKRYVLLAEYYNPTPVEVPYRGHANKLFKRDFAGEMLAAYPDLSLIGYGFVYHWDPVAPQDDLTWFLMEKK